MSDFKAKMHQIRFRLGLSPDPAGGAYSAPPDPLAGFGSRFAAGGGAELGRGEKGEGGRGKWRGGKGRAPKLLLNQGRSEPCYATAFDVSIMLVGRQKEHTTCIKKTNDVLRLDVCMY